MLIWPAARFFCCLCYVPYRTKLIRQYGWPKTSVCWPVLSGREDTRKLRQVWVFARVPEALNYWNDECQPLLGSCRTPDVTASDVFAQPSGACTSSTNIRPCSRDDAPLPPLTAEGAPAASFPLWRRCESTFRDQSMVSIQYHASQPASYVVTYCLSLSGYKERRRFYV